MQDPGQRHRVHTGRLENQRLGRQVGKANDGSDVGVGNRRRRIRRRVFRQRMSQTKPEKLIVNVQDHPSRLHEVVSSDGTSEACFTLIHDVEWM